MNINNKILGWTAELLILLAITVLFWSVNVFFAICIFTFHGITLIQIFKTQNLVGNVKRSITNKQKLCGAGLLLTVVASLIIQGFKSGAPQIEKLEQISNQQMIDLANGEIFPFLILLSFLSALLMFGITSERRRR